ncbi:serine--tRNA ligase, mitochondrial [Dendroctonus ponderosae]|uniref:serine--tRNA ligase, mitochondrial n=1 Tax=Dendroctonus ponderosae TaxID=77166 RepID=UPI002035DDCC|nr:serine--tRNA ligase, mitochondrial [Dendroctonus ponderosae]
MLRKPPISISLLSLRRKIHVSSRVLWNIPKSMELDDEYLFNTDNIKDIEDNISRRKSIGNIRLVNEMHEKLKSLKTNDSKYQSVKAQLAEECRRIPNRTHPDIISYIDTPKVIKYIGSKRVFDFPHKEFYEISKRLKLVRTEQLGSLAGSRTYYLLGQMAELEHALVRYFVKNLLQSEFQLVSVSDIVPRDLVESCGMNTKGERTQVYTLDPNLHGSDLCLSGTSEITLAGYLANRVFDPEELPLRLCAVSRCYRAETSSTADERGIFRVHEFTKVEMFIAALPDQSDVILEDLRTHQEQFFGSLGIHFQVLDMPPHDLGAPAYRKYDIEAWMPGRNLYGEISSCSNCTDFQARRLNIRYRKADGFTEFVHTLNGTACAIPRLLIALTETFQQSKGTILIPEVLQPFMHNERFISKQKRIPELMLIKAKK